MVPYQSALRFSCVVDTDVIIDYLRGKDDVRKLLKTYAERGAIAVSTLSHIEILRGMRPPQERATRIILSQFLAIPLDEVIARKAALMLRDLEMKGMTVDLPDAVIAATARDLGVPVITNNTGRYVFPGVTVIPGRPS